VFPSRVPSSPPGSQEINPNSAPSDPPERKRLCLSIEHSESAALPGLVDALVRDLRAFASRIDVFDTVFAEVRSRHMTHRSHEADEWWALINLTAGESARHLRRVFERWAVGRQPGGSLHRSAVFGEIPTNRVFFLFSFGVRRCVDGGCVRVHRGIDPRSIDCGGIFLACAMRWTRTAKQGYHERPATWTVSLVSLEPFAGDVGCMHAVDRVHGCCFRCFHGKTRGLGLGRQWRKIQQSARDGYLHSFTYLFSSIRSRMSCEGEVQSDSLKSDLQNHSPRNLAPLHLVKHAGKITGNVSTPQNLERNIGSMRTSRVPQVVGRRNDKSPFPSQRSPGPRSHLDGT
jgi:hypothetical protein